MKGIWEEADKLARNNFKRRKGSYRYYYQVTRTSGPMRRRSPLTGWNEQWLVTRQTPRVSTYTPEQTTVGDTEATPTTPKETSCIQGDKLS